MKFLYNAPAILHRGALIVGDTHFGMEAKLRRKGIHDEQFSLSIFGRLWDLAMRHRAKKVIFLGDVKEDVTMLDAGTEGILAKLAMLCELVIVKGNHDGGIERCGNATIVGPQGFVFWGLGLMHGHSWPGEELLSCRYVVCGHQHPMISMADVFGRRHQEAAWLVAPADEEMLAARYKKFRKGVKLILMPAFNPLVGSAINYGEKERLGPILNNNLFKLDDALVFRLDGTRLGKLKTIM